MNGQYWNLCVLPLLIILRVFLTRPHFDKKEILAIVNAELGLNPLQYIGSEALSLIYRDRYKSARELMDNAGYSFPLLWTKDSLILQKALIICRIPYVRKVQCDLGGPTLS